MTADIDLLKTLCTAPGPTGFEAPAQEVVRRRLEATFMGARARARDLDPAVIVVDADFCSDTPAAGAKKLGGEVKLGAGPVLGRGAGSNASLCALALEVAAAGGILVQMKAAPAAMSTDADELMAAGAAATLSLSVPVRYMHSPFEVAHAGDLEAAATLVAALARRVGEVWTAETFVPRG